MNLMKLFNIHYLLQNLKKSKVVLSIFIGLIPILNTIILTMMLTTNSNYILGFGEISMINFIGIYFLPIIISICLFNYIYKKKSVDFINSMPISRKSIFVTNTILGIIIFILMLIVNIILILILSTIFSIEIPWIMLLDYFWFFLLVYIFNFSATNLAMTVSGNAITQIVVTLLLFFLVPFTHFYLTTLSNENINYNILLECKDETCLPENYYCYNDMECELNKKLNRYDTNLNLIEKNHYTAPFGLIYNSILEEGNIIEKESVMKMIFLSIIYIILGYILFIRRKMEVSETSFKNIHIHNLVKSLTLTPFAAFAYIILREQELIFIIFVLVIMLIYYFVYDLITKKSIQHIRLSLVYFTITLTIFTIIFSVTDKDQNKNTVLNYKDIQEISVTLNNSGKTNHKIYIKNQKLINLMIKEMLQETEYTDTSSYIPTYLKTSDKQEYKTTIRVDKDTYEEMITLLSSEKEYINYYKNMDMNEVYAMKLGNKIYSKQEAKEYLKLIQDSLKNLSLKEFLELQQKYNHVSDDFYIKLYTYENHDKQEFSINGYINYNLLNSIVNSNNTLLKENISYILPNDYSIYYMNSYLEEEYNIDYYILRSAKEEIYNFILKDLKNQVDMKKEYITLQVTLDSKYYQFTTNQIEEFIEILNQKQEEIKDDPDYQDYINPDGEEGATYYD